MGKRSAIPGQVGLYRQYRFPLGQLDGTCLCARRYGRSLRGEPRVPACAGHQVCARRLSPYYVALEPFRTVVECYPDATGANPNLPRSQRTRTHFFNTDAFVDRLPFGPQYRYGNAARNTVIGPGIVDFDASVTKKFTVSESKYVEFRTEVFNLPNHPIWNPPGRQLKQPDYGVITSTRIDSRQIQFALKVVF